MALFFIPVFITCLIGIKFSGKDFRKDYMSVEATTAINGIFTCFVLMSHIYSSATYIKGGFFDTVYDKLNLNQLIVATFLFYSGYGIAQSVKNKPDYIEKMPKNRIFRVWLNLFMALIPYFILNLCFGTPMTAKQVILSLIGLDSLGNSNWFMLVILVLYLITYISFELFLDKYKSGTVLTTVLTGAFIAVLIICKKPAFWWNTAILYPLGMIFSEIKNKAEALITKNNAVYWICTALSAILFAGSHLLFCKTNNNIIFILDAVFMIIFITVLLMKFRIQNKALIWLGKNLFGIYILQRLPMLIIEHFNLQINKYIYTLLVTAVTVILAFGFMKLVNFIGNKITGKKQLKS